MLSFLLINKILVRILNSIENTQLDFKVVDELLLWKPLFEIFGFLRYDDPGRSYELNKTLFDSDFSFRKYNG